MADRYLIETSAVDGYLLEDGSGVLLIEAAAAAQAFPIQYTAITILQAVARASRW